MTRNNIKSRMVYMMTMSILLLCFLGRSHAQQFSNFDQQKTDSLAVKEYKQVLPIWGKQAVAKGFDLPEPLGFASNFMHFKQGLLLENIMVGFEGVDNSMDPVNLDDLLQFKELSTIGNIIMVKPDLWLFPFLSVYGIIGYVDVNTKVHLEQPIELITDVRTTGYNYGAGTTVAAGIKQWWVAGNFNWTWTVLSNLDQPNFARVTSVRAGKAHEVMDVGKLTYWFGAMHQKWGRTVSGAFNMSEILGDVPDATIPDRVRESENYQNMTPAQKAVVDPMLDAVEEVGQGFRENYDNLKMTYAVDKAPDNPWNMIVGANLALNRHWYLQAEFGFIGRFSAMGGVNYRFHL